MTATLDLARIAKGPEGQYLERKSLLDGEPGAKRPRDRATVRQEIAEVVAAFANTDGGTLLLGIEDDGTVTGHAYPDDAVNDMLLVPERRLQPPGHAGRVEQLDGKPVLVFDVGIAASAVMVTGNGYPVRQGDACVKMAADRINAWKQAGLVESWEARSSALSLGDLDPKLLALVDIVTCEHSDDIADYLLRRRLADERAGQLVLRRAAELLFARAPEKIDHPNACVRIFRVMGTERKTGALHNVEDLPRIEGAIPHVLQATFATIDPLLRRPKRLRGTTFEDAPEYPTFAWREAIVNAVAHRDYAIQGRGVEVWLFDDRMEIESPGGVVDAVSLEDLRGGRRAHASRNPRLSRVLVDLGYMREQGEGIPRMFGEMTAQFLPPPTVEGAGKTFKVTLRNTPNITPQTAEWLGNIAKEGLSEPQVRALVLALQHGSVSNAELRDATGLETLTASKALRDLRDRGLLAMRDSGSLTSYVLTQVARGAVERTGGLEPDTGGLGPDTGGLGTDAGGLEPDAGDLGLPADLARRAADLSPKARTPAIRQLIRELCAVRPLTARQLATLLRRRKVRHLAEEHLAPMVDEGLLERTIPENPTDPRQAFRTPATAQQRKGE
ncbi:MAG: putative DNA binding domain-containing protein [Deltaproteobacteria bacterium]|nr:putative DNA binding domain-containing protein [Deltaproteobacteria bacterium]